MATRRIKLGKDGDFGLFYKLEEGRRMPRKQKKAMKARAKQVGLTALVECWLEMNGKPEDACDD
jgi:hypothetical protein